MNWGGFLNPMAGLWFLLVGPLVILYFLKLRRPQLEVPSLVLWRSVINDSRVNSPFQKFKRNLLLLLQLALLGCLVLAAMRPFWRGTADQAQYLPVLIDCSASMAALDKPGGQSRLDLAKQEVGRLIDNLLPGQRLALIAVANSARSLCDFSDNPRILRAALDKLTVQHAPSRLEDGLRMAQALALTNPVETVLFYTDGNLPTVVSFDLPFELSYQKLPSGGSNVGITAVNAQRNRDGWDVFVRVDSTRNSAHTTTVEFWNSGRLEASELVTVDGAGSQRVVFNVSDEGAASLEVRLKPDGFDSLSLDNQAFLDLPRQRNLRVYCPLSLATYRQAMPEQDALVLYPDDEGNGTAAEYDLVITDQGADLPLNARMALSIGVIPEDLKELLDTTTQVAEIVDWQRSSPLLQYVQLRDVQLGDEPRKLEGVEDKAFEMAGYEILAQGKRAPLVLHRARPTRDDYVFLFHTDRSTLVYRIGFPILVKNILEEARRLAGLSEARSQPTGVLEPRSVAPDSSFTVTAPDGSRTVHRSSAEGDLAGIAAPTIGRYLVDSGQGDPEVVGVSLQSVTETQLEGVDTLRVKEVRVSAATARLQTDRPLWHWLALLGFSLLLIEWLFFQKRPAGMRVAV